MNYYGMPLTSVRMVIRSADFTQVLAKVWEDASYDDTGNEVYSADVTSVIVVGTGAESIALIAKLTNSLLKLLYPELPASWDLLILALAMYRKTCGVCWVTMCTSMVSWWPLPSWKSSFS